MLGEPDNDGELEEADASAAACPELSEAEVGWYEGRTRIQDLNQLPDELVEQFHATVISANNRQSGRQRKKTKRQQEADFNKLVYNS